jgi:hypothetical protein
MPFGSGSFGSFTFGGGTGGSSSPGVTTPSGWTLYLEADLSQAVEDIGEISGAFGALWDVAVWDTDVWPPGTTWTDLTPWLLGVTSNRGFSDELFAFNAGSMSFTLDNADGRFSPDNPTSPYRLGDSTTIGLLRPVRLRARYDGIDWTIFVGRLETWDETFGLDSGQVSVTAVDAFAELGAFDSYEQTPAGAGESYGARIARILDNADFQGETRIDVGVHTFQATDLSQNALTELKLTADSEGGAVWIGGDGIFYADGKNALQEKERSNSVQAVFSNSDVETAVGYEMLSVTSAYDATKVTNRAAYAIVGSTEQLATVGWSEALYGVRQDSRTDLVCSTDAQALSLAERHVALFQAPERRVESLTFNPDLQPSTERRRVALEAIARGQLALRALVRVDHTTPSGFEISKYLFVRGIHHNITPRSWTVSLDFTSATVVYGMVGSLWDVGVWDEAVWSW